MGVEDRVAIRVGTLSKARGPAAGGFVVGERRLVEWLRNRTRPYIYSTAHPPAVAAAATAAARDRSRRAATAARVAGPAAASLGETLAADGFSIGAAAGQIIPIVLGEPAAAMEWSAQLRQAGLFVPGIRPPSVAPGQSLLRISLCYGHTPAMIARLVAGLREIAARSCGATGL